MNAESVGPVPEALKRPYESAGIEERWYRLWEERGYFTPDRDPDKKPYTIAMPPPNLTGVLHYGHAVFITFQDLMIRWRRMQGYSALWLPGTDHAAIATNAVLVNQLAKEGKSREDLGRAGFEEMFREWVEQSGNTIRAQLRRAGASCDWTRERFTMDEGLSGAVNEAFVRLYEKGLIYRGSYLVNWDPADQTAVSDIEVEYQDVPGKLWYVRYPFKDGGHLVVATTRPETILGDTALAVNPEDERYKGLVGGEAVVPVIGRTIPIIADDYVDPEFGTGVVKVTPGHDPNDYAIGKRHDLEMVNILNLDGTLNENAGPYKGQDREVARLALAEQLAGEELIEKVEDYEHSVGHGQRSGAAIEPMLSEQWFVRAGPLAEQAAGAVRDGRIRFYPPRFAQVFLRWMDEIRDWCISRQIWVGHRLPVWYCNECEKTIVQREAPEACPDCGGGLRQDPDVLDTWFSSGLWPFSTLGWPDDTEDLSYFYPTSVMETGYEIIFFWVARMVMLGMELAGDIPFSEVYLNGMMRHDDGTKVSKSDPRPGDDPVEVIDKYGADALRFMIATGSSPGNDMKLVWPRLESARNFTNKLWNASRFTVEAVAAVEAEPAAPTSTDRWILGRLDHVVAETTRLLEGFHFGQAGRLINSFLWDEFCDWYIEASKARLRGDDPAQAARAAETLLEVLSTSLRLLHPYMPFVTEEIWSHLRALRPEIGAEHVIVAEWPQDGGRADDPAVEQISRMAEVVRAVRNARREAEVPAGNWVEVVVWPGDQQAVLEQEADFVTRLARVRPLRMLADGEEPPEKAISLVAGEMEVFLPLEGMVDLDAERERLEREVAALVGEIEHVQKLLGNKNFVERAPDAIVQQHRDRQAAAESEMAILRERLESL
ncbi:MAG: valine--tRNA ligase [Chloroflexota bacterium]|nr:valine--tRNA ligase [Chloroflexota bacterium]MDP6757800.1 valine--tRNA ligase [Chloroflexota bacterium]